MLCLRALQSALVYVNTLMVQDVLADHAWSARMTPADRRGLTPPFWTHVAPYGEVRLNMDRRLTLRQPPPGRARPARAQALLLAPMTAGGCKARMLA